MNVCTEEVEPLEELVEGKMRVKRMNESGSAED